MNHTWNGRSAGVLILAFFCVASIAHAQGTWTTEAPMPTGLQGPSIGVIDGKLYVASGCCADFSAPPFPRFNTLQVYDPAANSWTTKAPIPIALYAAPSGITSIGEKLYVAGGQADQVHGSNISTLQIYDATADTWTTGASLPAAGAGAFGGVINGKLYVAGGQDPSNTSEVSTLQVYDPATNIWTPLAPLPSPLSSGGSAVINGILYVVGGAVSVNFTAVPVNTVESYNPATNTWTTLAPMPTARYALGVGSVGGILYAVGGFDGTKALDIVEAYNPATNTWTQMSPMPSATFDPGVGVINGTLYVVGGSSTPSNPVATVQAFAPTQQPAQQPTAYVTNVDSNTVSVIDTASNSVVATIPVGTGPAEAAGSPDGTRVYITNENANTLSIIDTTTRTVVQTLVTGSRPFGVSFTPDGTHAYVANAGGNTVQVIDTTANAVSGTVTVGFGAAGLAVTPDGRFVYVANFFSDSVSVIDTASNSVVATVPVGPGPNWVAITPNGAFAYVPNFGSNTVSVIDTATNTVVATVTVGFIPVEVAISPDGTRAYVTSRVANDVSVIATASNTVLTTISVGFSPAGIALTPDGRFAYVANQSSAAVSVIDTTSNSVSAAVPVQINPFGVAIVSGGAGSSPSCIVKNTDVISQPNGASLSSEPTGLILNFIPPSGLSLNQFASQCGFTGFDWVLLIDQWPGPSGLFAELAPTVPIIIPPQPPQNDPPAGGYTYLESRQPPFAGAFPFYYNPQSMATSCAVFANGNCAEPIINNQVPSVTFFDAPTNPCLPGGAFFGNASECQGTSTSPSFMSFRTILVGICNSTPSPLCSGAGQPSAALYQVEWRDDFNGTTGGIPVVRTASSSVPDPGSGTGGLTITSINGTPQAPPSVSCTATPTVLWPPDGKEIPVNVSGTITPGTSAVAAANVAFSVIDTEGQVQPSGPVTIQSDRTYSLTIPLVASREGTDKNGRQYTIVVAAADNIGNVGSCSTVVAVPHDQGN